jgi:guanylate kinase
MSKYKILALIGEAGSGKDTLMQRILAKAPGLHEIVSCTTREPREGEIHGKNYFFLTEEEFTQKVLNLEMLEATHKNWFYGTSIDSLNESVINIGVFNPDGIYALLESPEVDLIPVYVRAKPKTRLLRQLNREENPNVDEIIRRYKTDKEDFYDLEFKYIEVENNDEEDLDLASHAIMVSLGLS